MDPWLKASRRLNLAGLGACGATVMLFVILVVFSPPSNDDWGLVGAFLILDVVTRIAVCMLPAVASAIIVRQRPFSGSALACLTSAALVLLFSGLIPWWSFGYTGWSLLAAIPAVSATCVHAAAAWRGRQAVVLSTMDIGAAFVRYVAVALALLLVPLLGQLLVSGYQQAQEVNDSNDTWSALLATYFAGWAFVLLWAAPEMLVLLASAVLIKSRPAVGTTLLAIGLFGISGLVLFDQLTWPWRVYDGT